MRLIVSAMVGFSLLAGSAAHAAAPRKLLLVNSTAKNVVISVELPDQTVHFTICAGSSLPPYPLRSTEDDRVVIARVAGTGGKLFDTPCKVLAIVVFKAPKVGDVFQFDLVGDDPSGYSFIYFLDGRPRAYGTPEMAKLYARHKKAIEKAVKQVQTKPAIAP